MGIYEAIKDGVEVARKADNVEVMKQLLDAQKEALDLFEENRALRERVRKLEEQAELNGPLKFRENKYWLEREGQDTEGPFCATCWDVENRLVRMQTSKSNTRDWIYCDWCTYQQLKGRKCLSIS